MFLLLKLGAEYPHYWNNWYQTGTSLISIAVHLVGMDLLESAVGLQERPKPANGNGKESLVNQRFLKKYNNGLGNYLNYYSRRFRDREEAYQNMSCWSYDFFLKWCEKGRKTFPTALAKYSYYAHLNGRVFGEPEPRFGGANHLRGRDFFWAELKRVPEGC